MTKLNCLIALAICFYSLVASAQITSIERISDNAMAEEANADSNSTDISGDGNIVVFASSASNLVDNDTNFSSDVFVVNRSLGSIERISVATDGTEGNGNARDPKISRDGRYVAFISAADNLVTNDTNGRDDVFVHDLMLGTTTLVGLSSLDNQPPSSAVMGAISADGRYVAFIADFDDASDTTAGQADLWLRDLTNSTTILISQSDTNVAANDSPRSVAISGDGQWIAFISEASNLVSDDTNSLDDVFVRNWSNNQTFRVSLTPSGEQIETGTSNSATVGGISDDGRYVCFQMTSTDLLDPSASTQTNRVFRHDRTTGANRLISPQDEISLSPHMSADGGFISYHSPSSFFSDAEVYLRRIVDDELLLISQNLMQEEGDDSSSESRVSADGSTVTFISDATNLVTTDTNMRTDVFVAVPTVIEDVIFTDGFE